MRPKGIAVIVGVSIVIISVVLLPITSENVPPAINDMPEFRDEANLGLSYDVTPKIFDDAYIESNLQFQNFSQIESEPEVETNEVNFFIDENGTKTYIIVAVDAPKVGE